MKDIKTFEIFFEKEKIEKQDLQKILDLAQQYDKKAEIFIRVEKDFLRFFLRSEKNLQFISSSDLRIYPTEKNLEIKTLFARKSFDLKNLFKASFDKAYTDLFIKKQVKIIQIKVKKLLSFANLFSVEIFYSRQGQVFFTRFLNFSNILQSFRIDTSSSDLFRLKKAPLKFDIEKSSKVFSSYSHDSFLKIKEVLSDSDLFLNISSFDHNKHTFIIGQTGTGKSKFIELFVKKLFQIDRQDYAVVLIDPHAVLYQNFVGFSKRIRTFNFKDSACELFPAVADPKVATELTVALFLNLLERKDARLEKILKYSLFALFSGNSMSLQNLRKILSDTEFRNTFLKDTKHEFLAEFFETDFLEIQAKFYDSAIAPVFSLLEELNFLPIFGQDNLQNLESVLKGNFLTIFSLNQIFLGEKATRLIAGLVIQQIFLLAQSGRIGKKIILIIDEVSVVQNPALVAILSEARKFGLSLYLAQQFLEQIDQNLQKAIFSNIYNYFIFKVSFENAKILSRNLQIDIKGKTLKDEEKIKIFVNLNPREVLVRIFKEQFLPVFKAKTLDI